VDEGLVELLEVSPCEALEVLPCELGRARPCEPPAGGLDGFEDRLHGLELAVRKDVPASFGPRGRGASKDALGSSSSGPRALLENGLPGREKELPRHRFKVEELGSHGPECRGAKGDAPRCGLLVAGSRVLVAGERRYYPLRRTRRASQPSTAARLTKVDELGSAGSGTMSGMENIQAQIQALLTSVRRQRFAIVGLATLLAGSVLLRAVSPAGDATFDTITCKEWKVVDTDGKLRIIATTDADGTAGVRWLDTDGKGRIAANTDADGNASVDWFDKDEMLRIFANTAADGSAGVVWWDKDEKGRIIASTLADGDARVLWFDKDEMLRILAFTAANGTAAVFWSDMDGYRRIAASTFATGTVVYPTKTGK
jgi:hypothetical protein